MSRRCTEPGWQLAAMHDPADRRGIWFRATFRDGRLIRLEVCGGREGDDYYLDLNTPGYQAVTREHLEQLHGILDTSRWLREQTDDLKKRGEADMTADVWLTVLEDMAARRALGLAHYGKPVTPDNAEDWLQHAYEEALDLAVYLKAELLRRKGENP